MNDRTYRDRPTPQWVGRFGSPHHGPDCGSPAPHKAENPHHGPDHEKPAPHKAGNPHHGPNRGNPALHRAGNPAKSAVSGPAIQSILRGCLLFVLLAAMAVLPAGCGLFTPDAETGQGSRADGELPDYSSEFNIPRYTSSHDEDGDGIDDQTDILQSAREYIATMPKYKSAYYSSGYPDDGYGVCTDVVGFALQGAGYDLMHLVNRDILQNPAAYGIDEPDINIDFRRVPNLNVYFSHTAQSLTTDPEDIEEWQGGDVVVFDHHIALVSDRRNRKGIPYIIHHVSASQNSYEQDALVKWEKKAGILGHYRIS